MIAEVVYCYKIYEEVKHSCVAIKSHVVNDKRLKTIMQKMGSIVQYNFNK